ncbi:unnamed protein product [Polarella glacialis]|uniref:Pentatricopeptide repeat-containing protein, chloroplastic n=1 Tax=Polarella glacialis TaxID=89957 RepID=A0A813FCC0_POLGL|nr:unnamed protein product [Polarella glacialis]
MACGSHASSASSHVGSSALVELGRRKQWTQALGILSSLCTSRAEVATRSYNAAASACTKSGQWRKVWSLLAAARFAGLELDQASFSVSMGIGSAEGERWEIACQLLGAMEAAGLSPDIIALSAAMSACEQGKQWKVACHLLWKMQTSARRGKKPPDAVAYLSAITACGSCGRWERAWDVFREMQKAFLQPEAKLHNAALGASCGIDNPDIAARQWALASELLENLRTSGGRPDSISLALALRALANGEHWAMAVSLLQDAGMTLKLNVIHFNAAITACGMGRRCDRALGLLQEAKLQHLQPDVVTHSAVMTAWDKCHQWEQASEQLCIMRTDGIEPNIVSHSALISALEKGFRWELAFLRLTELQESGMRLVLTTYNAALSAAGRMHVWSRVLAMIDEVKNSGLPVDAVTFGVSIGACSVAKWQWALQLLRTCREG